MKTLVNLFAKRNASALVSFKNEMLSKEKMNLIKGGTGPDGGGAVIDPVTGLIYHTVPEKQN